MWTCVPAWLAVTSLWWCWEEARAGLLQRWAVAGVGQWVKVKRDLNTALQKRKLFPLSILRKSPLIHHWVFLLFLFSCLNCCWVNPLFCLLIPLCYPPLSVSCLSPFLRLNIVSSPLWILRVVSHLHPFILFSFSVPLRWDVHVVSEEAASRHGHSD